MWSQESVLKLVDLLRWQIISVMTITGLGSNLVLTIIRIYQIILVRKTINRGLPYPLGVMQPSSTIRATRMGDWE